MKSVKKEGMTKEDIISAKEKLAKKFLTQKIRNNRSSNTKPAKTSSSKTENKSAKKKGRIVGEPLDQRIARKTQPLLELMNQQQVDLKEYDDFTANLMNEVQDLPSKEKTSILNKRIRDEIKRYEQRYEM